jgi:hypothetical protein
MPTPPHGCLAVSAATFEIARRQGKWEENRNFLRQFVDPMDLVEMKTWYLTSPEGAHHTAHNLCHFFRKNPRLFAAEDMVWKRRKAEKGLGSAYCKATAGFSNVRQARTRSWKGRSLTDGKLDQVAGSTSAREAASLTLRPLNRRKENSSSASEEGSGYGS